MHLEGDDILVASLLKAADNEPGVSPTLAEDATLLGENHTSQEVQKTTTCPPDYLEETPEPEGTAGSVDPHDVQEQIPPPSLVSGPPPFEDGGPLVSIPREAHWT